jgi:hypothetical protein
MTRFTLLIVRLWTAGNTAMPRAPDRSTLARVVDEPRPPVAIRVTRPYASEDEYLDHELDLLSRTGITLVGAQPRPQGVVLRFELVLASGQAVLRGEGRVVAFKPNAYQGAGGLALRFTRIDARSKALLDKAALLREQRRPSNRPAVSQSPKPPPPPPSAPGSIPSVPPSAPSAPSSAPPVRVAAATAPTDRNALLGRLRSRAQSLDADAVQRILEQGRQKS